MPIDHDCLVLTTESDVEQKIIMPLLTDGTLLGLPGDRIFTKDFMAPTALDKSAGRSSGYYPDYTAWYRGFPVLVVEAKSPDLSAELGYREASLYARHLNQAYRTNINPCRFIMSTNGCKLLFGYWDAQPEFEIAVNDLRPGSLILERLQRCCGSEILDAHALDCVQRLRARNTVYPYNLVGGQALLRARIPVNRFAADLSPVLRRYFASAYEEESREIVEFAYVSSAEVTEYDHVLEALLKDHLALRRGTVVQELQPSRYGEGHVERAISEFDTLRPVAGHLQILQGGVGSGKSLFVRRYKELLQHPDLADRTRWAVINFNSSPPDLSQAQIWLCKAFVEAFERENPQLDISSREVLRGVFSRKLQKRKSIYEELERASQEAAAVARADDLRKWQDDYEEYSRGIADYVLGSRREILLVVMDNVDRLDLKNQLAAFQLALWFMQRTRSFVVLQMRDETYDRYKDMPPLDAFKSGIIFHISPPRFVDVVKKRLELALAYLTVNAQDQQTYAIETGLRISYPKSALGEFLHKLYSDVFDRKRNISRVLEALAGRNIRRALDMFVSIITSGHLSEMAITSTVLGDRAVPISERQILKILMRTEYRFFSDRSGFLTNVFACDQDWQKPDNFLLIEILYFLARSRKQKGQIGLEGYFSCKQITHELQRLGYVPDDVLAGLNLLLKRELIGADHMNFNVVGLDDSVRILASGFMHVRILVGRIEYLHGVIPTTPIFEPETAARLAEVVRLENERREPGAFKRVQAVEWFFEYLNRQKRANPTPFSEIKETGARYVLTHMSDAIQSFRNIAKGTPRKPGRPRLLKALSCAAAHRLWKRGPAVGHHYQAGSDYTHDCSVFFGSPLPSQSEGLRGKLRHPKAGPDIPARSLRHAGATRRACGGKSGRMNTRRSRAGWSARYFQTEARGQHHFLRPSFSRRARHRNRERLAR